MRTGNNIIKGTRSLVCAFFKWMNFVLPQYWIPKFEGINSLEPMRRKIIAASLCVRDDAYM